MDEREPSKNTNYRTVQETHGSQKPRSPDVELSSIVGSNEVQENHDPARQGSVSRNSLPAATDAENSVSLFRHDDGTLPIRFLPSKSNWSFIGRKVHGVCALPPGYELALLPSGCHVRDINGQYQRPLLRDDEISWYTKLRTWWIHIMHSLVSTFFPLDATTIKERAAQESFEEYVQRVPSRYSRWLASHSRSGPVKTYISLIARLHCHFPALDLHSDSRSVESGNSSEDRASESISYGVTSSYSFSKGLVAIFQTIYASSTLYQTRGDQLQRYGYASFGLTVAPYLVMSLVNLINTVLTPDYPAVYMIKSTVMDEASSRGGYFKGTIGTIEQPDTQNHETFNLRFHSDNNGRTTVWLTEDFRHIPLPPPLDRTSLNTDERMKIRCESYEPIPYLLHLYLMEGTSIIISSFPAVKISKDPETQSLRYFYESFFVGSIAIAIVGGLSKFRAGHSTKVQRVWTMIWLVFGIVFGPIPSIKNGSFGDLFITIHWNSLLYSAPAIGGFVVVAQMLREYGDCIKIF
ncbi:hypothetical protein MMC14_008757 [Varicellaria rhodocarpa]|nr:hypothetical protein [Varicellaria rhodocarpa]